MNAKFVVGNFSAVQCISGLIMFLPSLLFATLLARVSAQELSKSAGEFRQRLQEDIFTNKWLLYTWVTSFVRYMLYLNCAYLCKSIGKCPRKIFCKKIILKVYAKSMLQYCKLTLSFTQSRI